MKTAHLLFGLATACAASPSPPSYPLCDRAGAPACGNIGQVGRSEQPRVTPAPARVVAPAPPTQAVAAPTTTQVLLGASSENAPVHVTGSPLMNAKEEVVCANVMSKGGSRRVCTRPDGTRYTATNLED